MTSSQPLSPVPPPGFGSVRRNTGELVADHLRGLIFEGRLHPGSRVHQDRLAKVLGVSHIPVREALAALEREGWIVIEPRRGAYVRVLDRASIADHFEILGFSFGLALRRAIDRTNPQFEAALRAVLADLRGTADPEEAKPVAQRFFHAVLDTAASPRVSFVVETLVMLVPANFFAQVPGSLTVYKRQVGAAIRAVLRHDRDAAAAAYARLAEQEGALVIKLLAARGFFAGAEG